MRKIIQLLLSFFFCSSLAAQKSFIDTGVEKKWPAINDFQVSNNGQYVCYDVGDQSGSKLIIQPISLKEKLAIPRAENMSITQNSEKVLFQQGDSLEIMELNNGYQVNYIIGVIYFRLIKKGQNNDLILYKLKEFPDEMIIRDMGSSLEERFHGVESYWISSDGNSLIIETLRSEGSQKIYSLNWLDIASNTKQNFWEGRKITSISIDEEYKQCAFSVADSSDSTNMAIWLYQHRDKTAKKIIDEHSGDLEHGFRIKDIIAMNGKDNRLFFNLEKLVTPDTSIKSLPVDIWSYKDNKLQSAQLHNLQPNPRTVIYKAVLNIPERKVIRLEDDHERIISTLYPDKPMKFLLGIKNGTGDLDNEWNWNKNALVSVYLISLKDGNKIWIDSGLNSDLSRNYVLTYNENYIIYYDARSENYYSYCISNMQRKNLTFSLHTHWTDYERSDEPDSAYVPYHIAGFIKNEDAILVYDRHDIFRLDPGGKVPALNLTKMRGKGDDLEIQLLPRFSSPIITQHQQVLYEVLDRINKKEGLFRVNIDSLRFVRSFNLFPIHFDDIYAIKPRDTDLNFVVCMTAEESPNIFLTSDFKTYKPVSDIHPEKDYNWMTTELLTWKTFDGITTQGILYKPENFDPEKKYPLLVYYYERLSDNLNKFLTPGTSDGRLNIPLYVSNGYIVFVPDIHYKVGWPGKSAYNCVVSGVKFLSRRKYIDATRMGLQGHSFGGFETNYIIAHSHLFAAAMSASAISDCLSGYNSVVANGFSRQIIYELHQSRIGVTLWQRPDLYIENSPILKADKVTTPLLMMSNKEDGQVPWQQGIEFFTALRRLGKKAWMLQYDRQGHNVDGKAAEDLTIRMFQFFNYYLKGAPPPVWMTRSIPAKLKGIDSGLELDTGEATPYRQPILSQDNTYPVKYVHREKEYNWMTTELLTWKTFDGSNTQGILYKPENFDANKKYPLLVYYYEQLSSSLNNFRRPGPSDGRLNIPFYVSHGYLVFVPDIHYKVGWPGRSAYNSVVSGVNYLSKRKYIDASRMGLQGHSFGGFETNYIITHSHLFAAAMSASGMTDFVSAYGSIIGDGTSRQRQYELYRDRIGTTLWQRPDLYIENSPVFRADKVTTPLLMMANKEDDDVPWQQGIEFFTALRRLGKRAWMLQYDGQGHGVDGKAADDLTIRMFQFFNYYLKGEPPPSWMTKGVPVELKGIDSGLEIDSTGAKP